MQFLNKIFFVDAETKSQCLEDFLRYLPAFAVEIGGELTKAGEEVLRGPYVGLVTVSITSNIEGFLI